MVRSRSKIAFGPAQTTQIFVLLIPEGQQKYQRSFSTFVDTSNAPSCKNWYIRFGSYNHCSATVVAPLPRVCNTDGMSLYLPFQLMILDRIKCLGLLALGQLSSFLLL